MAKYAAEIVIGLLVIAASLQINIRAFIKNAVFSILHSVVAKKQEEFTVLSKILLIILFGAFCFILTYKITEVPDPYHVDEAGMAYDAFSIANYGVDRYLYKYPVYLLNFGDGQSVLYAYLAAACIKLFGYSVISVRIPAIVLSVISALLFSFTVRREYGNAASIIMTGLFCVLPFSVMHSRWGLDCYLLFPMMIVSCTLLYKAVVSGKTWLFIVSGLSFGITLYTYVLSYIIIPLLLALCIIMLIYTKQINFKQLLALGIPLFFLALPLILLVCVNNGLINEIRTPYFSIPKLRVYRGNEISIRNIIKNLKLNKNNFFYRIFVYDNIRFNALIKYGSLYYFSLPILFWGGFLSCKNAVNSLKKRKFSFDFLMAGLFFSGFIISLLLNDINMNRACEVFIPLFYFLCIGILGLFQKRKAAAYAAGFLFLVNFSFFYHDYLVEYPKELMKPGLNVNIHDLKNALDFAKSIDNDKKYIYITQQPNIWTAIILETNPYSYNETKPTLVGKDSVPYYFTGRLEPDFISPEKIIISRDPDEIPDDLGAYGLKSMQFNSISVLYTVD